MSEMPVIKMHTLPAASITNQKEMMLIKTRKKVDNVDHSEFKANSSARHAGMVRYANVVTLHGNSQTTSA